MLNRRAMLIAVLSLAVGVAILVYRGPGVTAIRGFAGDIAVIVFLVAVLASLAIGTPRTRLLGVGVFATSVELLQSLDLVGPDAPFVLHLVLGSTFDPVDLAMYALGLGLAALAERWWATHERSGGVFSKR